MGLKPISLKKEISFIVGPRQAGKTTLMLLLKEYLEKKGEKTLFFLILTLEWIKFILFLNLPF